MKRLKVVMSVEDGLSVKNGPKGKKEHLARKGFRKLVNIEEVQDFRLHRVLFSFFFVRL